jgi:hypothetical protein
MNRILNVCSDIAQGKEPDRTKTLEIIDIFLSHAVSQLDTEGRKKAFDIVLVVMEFVDYYEFKKDN